MIPEQAEAEKHLLKVLIVSNHFWPANFRINDIAYWLVEQGHDVTVLTGVPDYPAGKFYPGYGIFKKRFEVHNGVKIRRYPLIPRGKGKALNLVFNYLSSALLSCLAAPFYCREKYDVIFVFHTSPIMIALPAMVMKKLRNIPLIFWNLDLWPESLSATGAVRSPWMLKLVARMVRYIYRNCDVLMISSRGFANSIKAVGGYEGEPLYFPNWVEPEYLQPADSPLFDRSVPALPEGFRVLFAGNVGAAQNFETILSAAEQLRGYRDIHWIIVGDGRRSNWLAEQVAGMGLEQQVHLLGRYPAEMMPYFFSHADALLLTLRDEPIFSLTVPGKLQSYLAAGKPILAGLNGEGAELVEKARAGLTCPAEAPGDLAENVLTLYRMPLEERNQLGENGRQFCLAHFNRQDLFEKLEKLMQTCQLS